MKREIMNRASLRFQLRPARAGSRLIPLAILVVWAANSAHPGLAQETAQPTFATASAASQGLFRAVQSSDEQAIASILGGPTELTSSGDQAEDRADREMFVQKYQEMHRVALDADRTITLYIGAENWPFP